MMTQNNDWIEWKWTPEKPYPAHDTQNVYVRFINGDECNYGAEVQDWNWEIKDGYSDITHYKLA